MVAAPATANPVFRKLRRLPALLMVFSSVFILFLLTYFFLLLFSLNPLPYIGRTILELDAIGFAMPKKIDHVLIHEGHVTQVQEDALSARFPAEQRFQLSYVFCFNSTAQPKDYFSVCCSRDP
jgi:hypothetical protein